MKVTLELHAVGLLHVGPCELTIHERGQFVNGRRLSLLFLNGEVVSYLTQDAFARDILDAAQQLFPAVL